MSPEWKPLIFTYTSILVSHCCGYKELRYLLSLEMGIFLSEEKQKNKNMVMVIQMLDFFFFTGVLEILS